MRLIAIIGCIVLLGYGLGNSLWPIVGLSLLLGMVYIYRVSQLLNRGKRSEDYHVVAISPDDDYLDYLLSRHESGIRAHEPTFDWLKDRTPASGDHAYLVVLADETVGLVLLHDAGDGLAQIELDYVLPRFRDFTPGEYVFKRSGVLRESGFTCVRTPPVNPATARYYSAIGFKRNGGYFERSLVTVTTKP